MSIIHEALKSMDGPPHAAPDRAASRPRKDPSAGASWLVALLAFAAVIGAGVLGWYVWQGQIQALSQPAALVAAPGNALVVPADVLLSSAPTAPLALPEMQALPEAGDAAAAPSPSAPETTAVLADPRPGAPASNTSPTLAADAALPQVAAATASATAAMAHSKEASAPDRRVVNRPVRQARPRPAAPIVVAPVSVPAAADVPVELLFARFVSAMQSGETAQAENALAALQEKLPAGSLGLLRAQAWFALQEGRDSAAAELYRTILERLPGDEGAAINLASLQSRQQQPEEARATLDAAKRLHPDSAALRAALAQFTPNARP